MVDQEHLYRVAPGAHVRLADEPTDDRGSFDGKAEARKELDELRERLEALQERLWAESKQALLVVIQAIDTGGKDGLIRKVFSGVNPAGCSVVSFKAPSEEERAHDYLWRIHARVPPFGRIGVFNRSHYEDVLVVRVHELVPESVWEPRYEQIRRFEEYLGANGTTIVKLFLHISEDEQKERFQARLDDPEKRWKFSTADLTERRSWDAYETAFEDMLSRTSTKAAPWHVIPADRKWYRDVIAARIIVEALERMDPRFPEPEDLAGVVVE
jgi:PPK2 family polyphosphate:nucleotide phosphotransferase